MKYNGYTIEEDKTGYAPKHLRFHFFAEDDEYAKGAGESLEDCKNQIDKIILEQIKEKLEFEYGWSNLDCEDKKWFVDELIKDVHSICMQTTS
jgi:hypothetical protein